MNAIDIHVLSSSYGEGFPNVIAEFMVCGTPCVVTNVGDSASIVGKTGWVVPSNNPKKLADALEKALNEHRYFKMDKKRCFKARLRIKENFSITNMINSYNKTWSKVYRQNNF